MKRAAVLFLAALLFSACGKNPVTGKREVHLLNEESELKLGEQAKAEIVREYGLYVNPAVQAYVNQVGERLVAVCERKNVPYSFVILDTGLVNAFAIPGTVFVTRGILDLIDDEAQLAAVMGHEIGHINGYHTVKLIQKSYGYGFLATLAAVAGTVYTPHFEDARSYAAYYDTLYRGIGLMTAGFLTGYGREFELEADRSGLRYAVLAGYDPDAMISFFKRMQTFEHDEVSGLQLFLRTHPPTQDRIAQVRKILDSVRSEGLSPTVAKSNPNQKKFAEILRSTATFEDHFEHYQNVVRALPKREFSNPGKIEGTRYVNAELGVEIQAAKGWVLEYGYGEALANFTSPDGKAVAELKYSAVARSPNVAASKKTQFAGVAASTAAVSVKAWAESMENSFSLRKRGGREVKYPVGDCYVGTYVGEDRTGRPAYFKILFALAPGKTSDVARGVMVSCGAPENKYLDYLVDFEAILKSLKID